MICAVLYVTGRWQCKPNILNIQQVICSPQDHSGSVITFSAVSSCVRHAICNKYTIMFYLPSVFYILCQDLFKTVHCVIITSAKANLIKLIILFKTFVFTRMVYKCA